TAIALGRAAYGPGLRLDAVDAAEDGHRAVEHAETALDVDREVDVAGRVDDVDAMVAPEARRGRRGDGDAALLLLDHPVHGGGPLVHLPDLVGDARVEEDALRGGGLPGIDVGHDADVAGALEWDQAGHDVAGAPSPPAVVGEGPVGLRHPVRGPPLLHCSSPARRAVAGV